MIGYKFFKINGYYWRKHLSSLIPLSMPHVECDLSVANAKKILKQNNVHFIRWDTNFDSAGPAMWWHVIKDEKEDIAKLPKKARNQVRRGLKEFKVQVSNRGLIVSQGYTVYKETFKTYNTIENPYSKLEFQDAILTMPVETEFWSVEDKNNGDFVGFSENLVRDGACFYMSIWILPEAMKCYASYALFYEMNKYYLNDTKLKYVSDGSRSISHNTNVHDFLISKFGFRKAYSTLNVAYSNVLYFFIFLFFPFRQSIKKLPWRLFQKISIVLSQEEIRRSCKGKIDFE